MSELSRKELLRVIEEFKSERDAAKESAMRAFDERNILLNENKALRQERDEAYERAAKMVRERARTFAYPSATQGWMLDCADAISALKR